jgi:hypothetical protein
MWQYNNTNILYNDELYHYGVLGMKWGMRKAYAKGEDYQYKSHGQKKYEKKVEKLTSKISNTGSSYSKDRKLSIATKKLSQYKQRDTNRQDYAQSTSVGKSVVKTLVFGPFGAGNYNRFRASGHGRVVSALGSNYIASTIGYPLTVLVSRSSELRSAKKQTN